MKPLHSQTPENSRRRIPLNEVQRTMLRWNSLHPYNVVDIAEILRPLDTETLRYAAQRVLDAIKFGIPCPDEKELHCVLGGSPSRVEVQRRSFSANPATALEEFAAAEMNRPFDIGRDAALRLALVEIGQQNFVCMTYQHWLMDGVAASVIFRRILAHALGIPCEPGNAAELDTPLYGEAFTHFLGAKARWMQMREGLGGLIMRTRACAPWTTKAQDCRVDVRILTSPPEVLMHLCSVARDHACTVNDVLLAGIFRAIDSIMPRRNRHPWHRNIAVCNIADLRPLAPGLQTKRGVYISFFGTHLRLLPRELAPLFADVRAQTARIKHEHRYLASLATFRVTPRLWNCLPSAWRANLLRTFFRYSSGLSNLRLDEKWQAPAWSGVLRNYTRVCPLGMMLPLLFGVTTRGDELSVTMTSMRGGYRREQLDGIARSIEGFLAGDFR